MTKLDLKKELHKYKRLCMKDDLTSLWNKRKLKEDLKRYKEISKRYGTKFYVMMLDIDGFKQINDTKGHKMGDKVLIRVSKALTKTVRQYQKIYRLSGDEFIVIFRNNNIDKIIKRIRKNLDKINIKVSIGYNILCKNILEVIDKKMYEDKRRKK